MAMEQHASGKEDEAQAKWRRLQQELRYHKRATNQAVLEELGSRCREEEGILDRETFNKKREATRSKTEQTNGIEQSIWRLRFARTTVQEDDAPNDASLIAKYAKSKIEAKKLDDSDKPPAFADNVQDVLMKITSQFNNTINDAMLSDAQSPEISTQENTTMTAILQLKAIEENMRAIDHDMAILDQNKQKGEDMDDLLVDFGVASGDECMSGSSSSSDLDSDSDSSSSSDEESESDSEESGSSEEDDDSEVESDEEAGNDLDDLMYQMAADMGVSVSGMKLDDFMDSDEDESDSDYDDETDESDQSEDQSESDSEDDSEDIDSDSEVKSELEAPDSGDDIATGSKSNSPFVVVEEITEEIVTTAQEGDIVESIGAQEDHVVESVGAQGHEAVHQRVNQMKSDKGEMMETSESSVENASEMGDHNGRDEEDSNEESDESEDDDSESDSDVSSEFDSDESSYDSDLDDSYLDEFEKALNMFYGVPKGLLPEGVLQKKDTSVARNKNLHEMREDASQVPTEAMTETDSVMNGVTVTKMDDSSSDDDVSPRFAEFQETGDLRSMLSKSKSLRLTRGNSLECVEHATSDQGTFGRRGSVRRFSLGKTLKENMEEEGQALPECSERKDAKRGTKKFGFASLFFRSKAKVDEKDSTSKEPSNPAEAPKSTASTVENLKEQQTVKKPKPKTVKKPKKVHKKEEYAEVLRSMIKRSKALSHRSRKSREISDVSSVQSEPKPYTSDFNSERRDRSTRSGRTVGNVDVAGQMLCDWDDESIGDQAAGGELLVDWNGNSHETREKKLRRHGVHGDNASLSTLSTHGTRKGDALDISVKSYATVEEELREVEMQAAAYGLFVASFGSQEDEASFRSLQDHREKSEKVFYAQLPSEYDQFVWNLKITREEGEDDRFAFYPDPSIAGESKEQELRSNFPRFSFSAELKRKKRKSTPKNKHFGHLDIDAHHDDELERSRKEERDARRGATKEFLQGLSYLAPKNARVVAQGMRR